MPSMEQYYEAAIHLNSKDEEKQEKALAVMEGLGSDESFEWKNVKCDKWAQLVSETNQLVMCAIDEKTSVKALICLNHLIKVSELTSGQIKLCLSTINSALKREHKVYSSIDFEVLRVVESLLIYFPVEATKNSLNCFDIVFSLTVHPVFKIRRFAIQIFVEKKTMLQQDIDDSITNQIKILAPKMKEFVERYKDPEILKLWGGIVCFCGNFLHRGASLINCLLEIMERAFKSFSEDVLLGAYENWKFIIDNFASNRATLTSLKRLQLLLRPLVENIKLKEAATVRAKIFTWWHLADKLGPDLETHFDKVVVPLLQYCFGKYSQSPGAKNQEIHECLISSGVHIFARLCEAEKFIPGDVLKSFNLSPLWRFSPSSSILFLHHHQLFLSSATAIMTTNLPSDSKIILYIWRSFNSYLKISSNSDLLAEYFRTLESLGEAEVADPKLLFDIIDLVGTLPNDILYFRMCNFNNGSLSLSMNVIPASILLKTIFGKYVKEFIVSKKFASLFRTLTDFSSPSISASTALDCYYAILTYLDKTSHRLPSSEMISKLWHILANQLLSFMETSQDINQGTALQPDFNCAYTGLIFPFKHLHQWNLLPSATKKAVWKTWEKLYQTSTRIALLIPGINNNTFAIEFSSKLKTQYPVSQQRSPHLIEVPGSYNHAISTLLNHINLSDITINADACNFDNNNIGSWVKRNSKPICTISPLLALLSLVTDTLVAFDEENSLTNETKNFHCNAIVELLQSFEKIGSNLRGNEVFNVFLQLTPVLAKVLSRSSIANSNFANGKVLNKLEIVWSIITQTVATNYTGLYNGAMLVVVEHLMEIAFTHPNNSIKSATWTFWNSTFYPCYNRIPIPKRLKKLFEDSYPTQVTQETIDDNAFNGSPRIPISEITCETSNLGSPTTPVGSLLKRTLMSKLPQSLSPVTDNSSENHSARPKRRLSTDDLSKLKFIIIEGSPATPKVKTPRQLEKLTEISIMPALRNSLSQDSQIIPESLEEVKETPSSDSSCDKCIDLTKNDSDLNTKNGNIVDNLHLRNPPIKHPSEIEKRLREASVIKKVEIPSSNSALISRNKCQPIILKNIDNGNSKIQITPRINSKLDSPNKNLQNESLKSSDASTQNVNDEACDMVQPKNKRKFNEMEEKETKLNEKRKCVVARCLPLSPQINEKLKMVKIPVIELDCDKREPDNSARKEGDRKFTILENSGNDIKLMSDVVSLDKVQEACAKPQLLPVTTENVVMIDRCSEKVDKTNSSDSTAAVINESEKKSQSSLCSTPSSSSTPTGILKKCGSSNSSNSMIKRRVSFADPPVQSESSVSSIDNSLKRLRSRKKFVMQNIPRPKESDNVSTSPELESTAILASELKDLEPICKDLSTCNLPMTVLLPHLSIGNARGFSQLLNAKSITTVGDFCKLNKNQIQSLPLNKPKLVMALQAISSLTAELKSPSKSAATKKLLLDNSECSPSVSEVRSQPEQETVCKSVIKENPSLTKTRSLKKCKTLDKSKTVEERKSIGEEKKTPEDDKSLKGNKNLKDNLLRKVFEDGGNILRKVFEKTVNLEESKSLEENKSLDERKNFEENKSLEKSKNLEENKSLEERKNLEENKSLEERKNFEENKSLEERKNLEENKSLEEKKNLDENNGLEENKSVEDNKQPVELRELKNAEENKAEDVQQPETIEVDVQNNYKPEFTTTETQTLEVSFVEMYTETSDLVELKNAETETVVEIMESATQTTCTKVVNRKVQTKVAIFNTVETETTDLIGFADSECQIEPETTDAQTETISVLKKETYAQTNRNIDLASENPFEQLFKNFRSGLEEIKGEKINSRQYRNFNRNMVELMKHFDDEWGSDNES